MVRDDLQGMGLSRGRNRNRAPWDPRITVFDPAPVPRLSISGASHIVLEDERNPNTSPTEMYSVTMSPLSHETVTVDIATEDGTAKAGEDYSATSMTLTFAPGTWHQRVGVGIRSDTLVEPPEKLPVRRPVV